MIQDQTTLDDLIAESIRNAISSDSIQAKVEAAADKAISEAISNAFGYSSPFRKGVEETIKSILPIPRAEDLARFADATRELLQRRLSTIANDTAKQHLEEVIEKILPDNPIVTFDELKEAFEEKCKDEIQTSSCECREDYDLEYTWEIERSSSTYSKDYWDLIVSSEPDASRYGGKSQSLRFKAVDGTTDLFECWCADGFDGAKGKIFYGPLYGFDLMVWRLASGLAKLKK
jgi:hypothetical protein